MEKQIVIVLSFLLIAISLIGAADASTLVTGKIFNADYTETIPGASVQVACGAGLKNTTSIEDGTYTVIFPQTTEDQCALGDQVHVFATKDNLYGERNGVVNMSSGHWDVSIVNVPLVPEFGLLAGALTIVASVVIFFVVRRE